LLLFTMEIIQVVSCATRDAYTFVKEHVTFITMR